MKTTILLLLLFVNTQVLTSFLQHASVPENLKYSLLEQEDYAKDLKANATLEALIGKGFTANPAFFILNLTVSNL